MEDNQNQIVNLMKSKIDAQSAYSVGLAESRCQMDMHRELQLIQLKERLMQQR